MQNDLEVALIPWSHHLTATAASKAARTKVL